MSLVEENPVIGQIYSTRFAHGSTGSIAVHSEISQAYAEALYNTVLRIQPRCCIEIGMAFGLSSLAILTALRQIGSGRLISVDPGQSTQWRGAGLEAVANAGLTKYHQLIEEPDFKALPYLLERGTTLDFAYIDGWHTFDYTLLDFFYIDKMLRPAGVVAFNDCGCLAVDRVIRFVQSHRKYTEIDAGLGASGLAKWKNRLRSALGGPLSHTDRYFEKVEAWEPNWDFYAHLEPRFRSYNFIRRLLHPSTLLRK